MSSRTAIVLAVRAPSGQQLDASAAYLRQRGVGPVVVVDRVALALFASAGSGVDAALALQQHLARRDGRSSAAIGLAIGDVNDATGLDGPAVGQALDLMGGASTGRIAATDLVARLDPGHRHLYHPTELTLPAGDGDPTMIVEIEWSPKPTVQGTVIDPPPALDREDPLPLVGRDRAWEQLAQSWSAALGSRLQGVILSGESGAGKSRLASSFARVASDRGALVLWGACTLSADLPFQPFVEAIGRVLSTLDEAARAALLGAELVDLAPLLPRLLPAAGADPGVDPATARYWMFEAVVVLLRRLSAEAPVLLVLDDLHWALESTLRLLDHVVRSGGAYRICVIGIRRDDLSVGGESWFGALTELGRLNDVQRVTVPGLDDRALDDLLTRLTGRRLDTGLRHLRHHLARTTGGNAFLVGELWRELVESGIVQRVAGRWSVTGDVETMLSPVALREIVAQRVRSLERDTGTVLAVAALAGSPFDGRVVARAVGQAEDETFRALDTALAAGFVLEDGVGRYRFRHDLVAQALADGMAPHARRTAHRDLAQALAELRPELLHVIADQYRRAVPLVAPEVSAEWAMRAAHRALAAGKLDDATSAIGGALEVVEEPMCRIDLLDLLSRVTALAGDHRAAVRAADEAAALAQASNDPQRLVAAAVLFEDVNWRSDGKVAPRPEQLDAALAVAVGGDRARLLASKATTLTFNGRDEEALGIGDEAVAVARSLGDEALLSRVMHQALFAGWLKPDRLVERRRLAAEATALARRAGDDEAIARNLMKEVFGESVLGSVKGLRARLNELHRLAPRLRQPWMLAGTWGIESFTALAEGRLDVAEQAVDQFDAWSQRLTEPLAGLGLLTFALRREQGRLAQVRPVIELIARHGEDGSAWSPGLAVVYSELGMVPEAAKTLDRLIAGGFLIGKDHLRLVTLSFLADACAACGHRLAEKVYDELAPWSGHSVWAPGVAVYGAADRYLGRLAASLGRRGEALTHLERAVHFDDTAGWPTWRAHSHLALGEFLLEQGRRDRDRAERAIETAATLARQHGLTALAARCASRKEVDPQQGQPVSLTAREREILRLAADGLSNREIGERLHTSRHTVANQIHSILVKTGCSNRVEAITWAHRGGLLSAGVTA